jgi:uncharacterized membrane protein YqiK
LDLYQLMGPKLIAGVVVVILVIIVALALYVRNARTQPQSSATVLGQSTSGQCKCTGPNVERKRNWRIVRREVERLKIRDLNPTERNALWASGNQCSLVL